MERLNTFEEGFEKYGERIAIGQTFMINCDVIYKWLKDKNTTPVRKGQEFVDYEYEEYGYNCMDHRHQDFYFIVKYIGNGYVQEMLTGETMLLTNMEHHILEDNSDELVTADNEGTFTPSHFEDFKNADFEIPTLPEYIFKLETYKNTAAKSPFIVNVDVGGEMFRIDDISKAEYLKHSNEEKIALIKEMKAEALSSQEETIKDIETTIQKYSRITPETLDMAYLENEIYDFEKQGKTR